MGLFNDLENKEQDKKHSPKSFYIKSFKRKGKVASIIGKEWLIVDIGGNGERIKYSEKEHSNLKVGDTIELP